MFRRCRVAGFDSELTDPRFEVYMSLWTGWKLYGKTAELELPMVLRFGRGGLSSRFLRVVGDEHCLYFLFFWLLEFLGPTGVHLLCCNAKSTATRNITTISMYAETRDSSLPAAQLAIGSRVSVHGKVGTVRYVGTTQFSPGQWVGIELDLPEGKNDGSVQGVQYFICESQPSNGFHGLFVRPNMLKSSAVRASSVRSSTTGSPRLPLSPKKMVCRCPIQMGKVC